jgi:uncharacterized membrane protein
VARASASGEMLSKQNRSAYRAGLMDASGMLIRWGYLRSTSQSH